MSEIAERNNHRHSHDVPQCRDCRRFLPKRSEGRNVLMCNNCGTPNTYWV